MSHVKPADCTLIVISSQHLLAEQRIANLTEVLDIKTHLIELFPNAFPESALQGLQPASRSGFILTQQRKVFFIKPACDVKGRSMFFNGRLLTAIGSTELSILQIPKSILFELPERHIRVMSLYLCT